MSKLTGFLSRLAGFEPLRAWYRMLHQYVADVEADFAQSDAAGEDEDYYQYMNDRWLEAREVANIGAAGLCVAISSRVENDLKYLMRLAGFTFRERANFGDIEACWKRDIEATFGPMEDLPRHDHVRRIRLMANCFKHNQGRVSCELLKAWPVPPPFQKGESIDFLQNVTDDDITAASEYLSGARQTLARYEAAQSN